MNPFFVGSLFLCLAIFIAAMLCEYLSKDPKSEAGLVAEFTKWLAANSASHFKYIDEFLEPKKKKGS